MTSPDFWTILRSLAGSKDSSRIVFDILERGTSGNPPAIMADNYEAAIALLGDFASASRHAAPAAPVAPKTKMDAKGRKERPAKKAAVDNELVSRGLKAVNTIYNMTGRVPHLMKQSHLDTGEGKYIFPT
jgi:brefeldin A-resistance guanine nucleotide exchange factor 1